MHIEYKPGTYVQLCVCVYMLSCLTFCGPMDYSLAGSSVHGILQARILEWLPFPPLGDLTDLGIKPESPVFPALASVFFTTAPHGKPYVWLEAGKS